MISKLHRRLPKAVAAVVLALGIGGLARADGLVIRGGACSADAFKSGSGVSVIPPGSDNIFDLSVNCTTATNNKADFKRYTTGIPNPTFCVATIQQLERLGAKIVPDPIKGNPLHCLVSGNAKKIATKLSRFP